MSFEDYLVEKLGNDYKEVPDNRAFRCPFCHRNDDYKLYVNTSGGEKHGLWHCQRCKSSGNPVKFVMEYENVKFKEAKEILEIYGFDESDFFSQARESGLSEEDALYLMLMGRKEEENKELQKTPPPLPEGYKMIVNNLSNPEVLPFVDYLVNKRKVDADFIPLHNIGYITNGSTLTSTGKKISLRNHLVFLTHGFDGNYIYWNTRSIDPNPYLKSINASGNKGTYTKSEVVFNLNVAKHQPRIVLTEGVFDALAVGLTGVAAFGKHYSKTQIDLILRNVEPHQRIYILLDRDAIQVKNINGVASTIALATKLYDYHKETYIVVPETNEDPGDLGTERIEELIRNKAIKATPEGRMLASMI